MSQFSPKDLVWIKNIKRDEGTEWAYFEEGTDKIFNLNWPGSFKSNAKHPVPNQIILLFQKVNHTTYFTHLVSPLDNELKINHNNHRYPWERKVEVLARSAISNDNNNFNPPLEMTGGFVHGNVCQLGNIIHFQGGRNDLNDFQNQVFKAFNLL